MSTPITVEAWLKGNMVEQLRGLKTSAAAFRQEFSQLNQMGTKIGKELDKATDGFDRLRQQVDQTVDPLRLFGKRGIEIANAIDDIPEPARRTALALRELRDQTNPGLLERFNRQLSGLGAELEVARAKAGPLGMALGAALGAVATAAAAATAALLSFLKDGIDVLIERSKTATVQAERLDAEIKELSASMATGATRGAEMDRVLAGAAVTVNRLAAAFNTLNSAQAMIPESARFVLDGFNAMFNPGSAAVFGIQVLERLGNKLGNLSGTLNSAAVSVNNMAAAFGNAAASIRDFFNAMPGPVLEGLGKTVKDWADAGGQKQLKDAEQMIRWTVNRASAGTKGGGGGGRSPDTAGAAERGRRIGELVQEFAPTAEEAGFAGGFGDVTAAEKKTMALERRLELAAANVRDQLASANASLEGIGTKMATGLSRASFRTEALKKRLQELGQTIKDEVGAAFLDLGVQVSTAMGAFAAGKGTLRSFAADMGATFANLAGTLSRVFMEAGAGIFVLNPAKGALLIGAGLALGALSGAGGAGAAQLGSGASSPASIVREVAGARERLRQGAQEELALEVTVAIPGASFDRAVEASTRRLARQRRM